MHLSAILRCIEEGEGRYVPTSIWTTSWWPAPWPRRQTAGTSWFQTDLTSGVNTTICSAASGTTSGIKSCSFSSTTFDFTQYVYWILAVVNRTDTSSFPVLVSLRIN